MLYFKLIFAFLDWLKMVEKSTNLLNLKLYLWKDVSFFINLIGLLDIIQYNLLILF